jgi:hypothetical protein
MGIVGSRSLRLDNYVALGKEFVRRFPCVPFRHFLGDVVRREFARCISAVLRGTLGSSYPRHALQGGGAHDVACLCVPRD